MWWSTDKEEKKKRSVFTAPTSAHRARFAVPLFFFFF